MTDWETTATKLIHETPWFRIIEDKVSIPEGKTLTYTYLDKRNPSAAIIAVNGDGDVLLQRQYTYPIKHTIWTIPGGHCEDDEPPLAAAKRELEEETGLKSDDWQETGMFYVAAGISKNIGYSFIAHVSEHDVHNNDPEEVISDQMFVSVDKLREMLQSAEIVDAFSLIPIYRYLDTLS